MFAGKIAQTWDLHTATVPLAAFPRLISSRLQTFGPFGEKKEKKRKKIPPPHQLTYKCNPVGQLTTNKLKSCTKKNKCSNNSHSKQEYITHKFLL